MNIHYFVIDVYFRNQIIRHKSHFKCDQLLVSKVDFEFLIVNKKNLPLIRCQFRSGSVCYGVRGLSGMVFGYLCSVGLGSGLSPISVLSFLLPLPGVCNVE